MQTQGTYDEETPVLIVGGSLVGLSMSLFLSWHGVDSLLVERHPGVSPHPRAAGFNPRTLEIYRSVGVEAAIRQAESAAYQNSGILRVETLTGKELGWLVQNVGQEEQGRPISPTHWSIIAQSQLEPILRARAEELGGDLRFNTEFVSFAQDADGVSAVIRDRATGAERTVRARYLIAADGNRSDIRQSLGIAVQGRGALSDQISILFRADMREALRGRSIFLCFVMNPAVQGVIGLAPDGQSGGLVAAYHPEKGEREEEFAGPRGVELVRAAIGDPDLPVEVSGALSWKLAAWVAEQFQQGRVFLVGDSAHVMPPTGAFGANTGIADAHNLAWKLALVLNGAAGSALLSTYEAERRPVAEGTVEQSFARYVDRMAPHHADKAVAAMVENDAVVFGYRYDSAALFSENGQADCAPFEDPHHPSGRPGTRAPHVVLERQGERISTLDLLGRHFVLLCGSDGGIWQDAALRVAGTLGLELDAYRVGSGCDLVDTEDLFHAAYGVTSSGAVLVRPDGFVGWRAGAVEGSPEDTLERVILHLLGR